jgi:sugar/nucleoside kinase (ribokinase family)
MTNEVHPTAAETGTTAARTLTAFGEIALHVCMPWRASVRPNDDIGLDRVDLAVGGGTSIVCQHLAALGHRVLMVAIVASDGFGDAVLRKLEASGVELAPVLTDGSRTTVAVVESAEDASHRVTYSPSDAAPASFVTHAALADEDGCRFTYSPGFPGYERLLETLADLPVPLIVDLGYRPWLSDVATYRDEVLARSGFADYVALSGSGLADDQLARLMREVVQSGASAAVATLGRRGAVVMDGATPRLLPGVSCRPRHTVGAGDAFVAGMIAGLSEGMALTEAATLGNATAAGRISAFPRVLQRSDIDAIASTGSA